MGLKIFIGGTVFISFFFCIKSGVCLFLLSFEIITKLPAGIRREKKKAMELSFGYSLFQRKSENQIPEFVLEITEIHFLEILIRQPGFHLEPKSCLPALFSLAFRPRDDYFVLFEGFKILFGH